MDGCKTIRFLLGFGLFSGAKMLALGSAHPLIGLELGLKYHTLQPGATPLGCLGYTPQNLAARPMKRNYNFIQKEPFPTIFFKGPW